MIFIIKMIGLKSICQSSLEQFSYFFAMETFNKDKLRSFYLLGNCRKDKVKLG
jgi:hypothetical protein